MVAITLGSNIQTAITANANGTIFTLAKGIYYGQQWTAKPGQQFVGDPFGGTVLSGAWRITSWTNTSGSLWAATQGLLDTAGATQTNLPAPQTSAVVTASLNTASGGQMVVTAIASGSIAIGATIYNDAGSVVTGAQITSQVSGSAGSTGTYQLSTSQTLASGTIRVTNGNGQYVNPMANFVEELWIDNVRQTRIKAPGPATAGNWWLDASTSPPTIRVFSAANPATGHLVEYTARDLICFDTTNTGVVMRSITVEKYATKYQLAPISGIIGWTFRNCRFQFNHSAGLNIGSGNTIDQCYICDNGQTGIEGGTADDSVISQCEIARNNTNGYDSNWDAGGIKLAVSAGVKVLGCNIHDNKGPGIWADIACSGWEIADNYVANQVTDGTNNNANGIFFEISYGMTKIHNNVVLNNQGLGIYLSNSSGCEVWGNTVVVGASNANFNGAICMTNQPRSDAPADAEARNNNIHDNVMVHATDTANSGYFQNQAITAPLTIWDRNIYMVPNLNQHWQYISSTYTFTGWQSASGFDTNSTLLVNQLPLSVSASMALIADSQPAGSISSQDIRQVITSVIFNARGVQAWPIA